MKKILPFCLLITLSLIMFSCGEDKDNSQIGGSESVENSPNKDAEIQRYNLEVERKQSNNNNPCDTLSLKQFVLENYPEGSYLVDFDKTLTYNIPKSAVIYLNRNNTTYVFGVVALSKPGERLIEPKNIVGYDQSFIDLDSTKLGTAFFYLVLFQCDGESFSKVWEAPIPSHGGFNRMSLNKWRYKGIPYVQVNFHYARGVGHINYNYFMIDGLTSQPHLLMTYEGINFKRTMANVNNDNFPDYYEFLYYDLGNRIVAADSIPFYWSVKDSVYINKRNRKQTRPY